MNALDQTREQIKDMKIQEKLYKSFNVSTKSILTRLGLMFAPFGQFQKRQGTISFDLYLPLMGNLLYVVISCYLRSFSEEAFSMVMLSRTLGLAMVIFAANVGICFLLKKTLPD